MNDAAAIEQWWPHLDIDHKHAILSDLDAPLSQTVLDAVSRICAASGDDTDEARSDRLSDAEKGYIRTQIEPVD